MVGDLPTALSLSLTVWSTKTFVFFGTFSFTICVAGGPEGMRSEVKEDKGLTVAPHLLWSPCDRG